MIQKRLTLRLRWSCHRSHHAWLNNLTLKWHHARLHHSWLHNSWLHDLALRGSHAWLLIVCIAAWLLGWHSHLSVRLVVNSVRGLIVRRCHHFGRWLVAVGLFNHCWRVCSLTDDFAASAEEAAAATEEDRAKDATNDDSNDASGVALLLSSANAIDSTAVITFRDRHPAIGTVTIWLHCGALIRDIIAVVAILIVMVVVIRPCKCSLCENTASNGQKECK